MQGKPGNRVIIQTSSGRKLVDHLLLVTSSSPKTALRISNAVKGKLVPLVPHSRLGQMPTRDVSLVGLDSVDEKGGKGSPGCLSWPPQRS